MASTASLDLKGGSTYLLTVCRIRGLLLVLLSKMCAFLHIGVGWHNKQYVRAGMFDMCLQESFSKIWQNNNAEHLGSSSVTAGVASLPSCTGIRRRIIFIVLVFFVRLFIKSVSRPVQVVLNRESMKL